MALALSIIGCVPGSSAELFGCTLLYNGSPGTGVRHKYSLTLGYARVQGRKLLMYPKCVAGYSQVMHRAVHQVHMGSSMQPTACACTGVAMQFYVAMLI